MRRPRVLIFGHSHAGAIQKALAKPSPQWGDVEFEAYQFIRKKNGTTLGDVTVEHALKLIGELENSDLVVSCIGGNQHNVVGLVQHPVPFDVLLSDDRDAIREGAQVIPAAAMLEYFEAGIRRGDGMLIKRLRDGARGRFYHLCPPPPKEDEQHILKSHETNFARAGILERGVSPAPLRARLWTLQGRVLEKLCEEWDVELLPPPGKAVSHAGFLKPEYFSADATHANTAYGALVLLRLAKIAKTAATARGRKASAHG